MLLTLLRGSPSGPGGPINGDFVSAEGQDLFSSSGGILVSGGFAVSDENDVFSSEGVVRISGGFSATEGSDTFDASGEELFFVISGSRALYLLQVYRLHGLDMANPLIVDNVSRTSGDLVQSISEAGGSVTLSKTSGPTVFSGDINEIIDSIARVHGLAGDLVVTSTSRIAGTLDQSISQAGDVVTVTRTQ